jgi:hypothetical protein
MLAHQDKPWVVFAHGTCVVLMEPELNVAQQAVVAPRTCWLGSQPCRPHPIWETQSEAQRKYPPLGP